MRRLIVALFALLLPAVRHGGASARPFDQAPKEEILGWINEYRHDPDPDRVPFAVRGMSRLGLLSDPEGAGVYVGFLAGIIASNPDKADELIAKMFPLSPEHQWAIVRAIAYSGRPEWRTLLRRVAERMPARRVMIERFLAGKLPTLDAGADREGRDLGREGARAVHARQVLPQSRRPRLSSTLTPDLLDTLWGYYLRDRKLSPALAHRR